MNYNIRISMTLYITIVSISNILAYDWPLVNGQTQHQINATFGECRGNRDHFHNGVDIQATQGTAVYAIEGGTAYISGSGINIGHYRYFHLTNFQVTDETEVEEGILIGYTDTGNHIHFIECENVLTQDGEPSNSTCLNPLRTDGLTPFEDNGDPIIDDVTIYRQGTNDVVQLETLYGKLDFAIQAHDPGVTATGAANNASSCGIYSVSIEFRDENENLIGQPINNLTFDDFPDNTDINWAFADGSNSSTFIYWATNDPFNEPHNKYWNTRQRVSCSYDVNARYAGEALYNEGVIRIRVVVEDIAGNRTIQDLVLNQVSSKEG